MKFVFNVLFSFIILKSTSCSDEVVADIGYLHKTYCPEINNICDPSTEHILCKFYDPVNVFGEKCEGKNPEIIEITQTHKDQILIFFNSYRAKAARGILQGQETLPRAYGLKVLEWDSEIAAHSQLILQQCFPHGTAAATDHCIFREPHTLAEIPFTETLDNISDELRNSYNNVLRKLTREHILNPPGPGSEPYIFLQMLNRNLSRFGCAAIKYEEKKVMLCLLPIPPVVKPVYNTISPNYTFSECGCPRGTLEDNDCLCKKGWPSSRSTYAVSYQPKYDNKEIRGPTTPETESPTTTTTTTTKTTTTKTTTTAMTSVSCIPSTTELPKQVLVMLPVISVTRTQVNPHNRRFGMSSSPRSKSNKKVKFIQELNKQAIKLFNKPSIDLSMESQLNNLLKTVTPSNKNKLRQKLSKKKRNIVDYRRYSRRSKQDTNEFKVESKNNRKQNYIMSLLDALEQTAKKNNLNNEEMNIFDAKMRRIYKTMQTD